MLPLLIDESFWPEFSSRLDEMIEQPYLYLINEPTRNDLDFVAKTILKAYLRGIMIQTLIDSLYWDELKTHLDNLLTKKNFILFHFCLAQEAWLFPIDQVVETELLRYLLDEEKERHILLTENNRLLRSEMPKEFLKKYKPGPIPNPNRPMPLFDSEVIKQRLLSREHSETDLKEIRSILISLTFKGCYIPGVLTTSINPNRVTKEESSNLSEIINSMEQCLSLEEVLQTLKSVYHSAVCVKAEKDDPNAN